LITLDGYNQRHQLVGTVFATLYRGNLTGHWHVRSFGSSDIEARCRQPCVVT
jgi:hypothetical protein